MCKVVGIDELRNKKAQSTVIVGEPISRELFIATIKAGISTSWQAMQRHDVEFAKGMNTMIYFLCNHLGIKEEELQ